LLRELCGVVQRARGRSHGETRARLDAGRIAAR
jgi:hypothetical protein